jgi:hypothetical protein
MSSNFNIRDNVDLNMSNKRFLRQFSNYSYGDRKPILGVVSGNGMFGSYNVNRGGTNLNVIPINNIEAQQTDTVQSIDLVQRPSDYLASSGVMKEIIKKTVDKQNRDYQMRTPQVDAVSKIEKKGREIGKQLRQSKSKEASMLSIVEDYQRLKTKKGKKEFISSLGLIYRKNPTDSKYILDGIEAIKKL